MMLGNFFNYFIQIDKPIAESARVLKQGIKNATVSIVVMQLLQQLSQVMLQVFEKVLKLFFSCFG